MKISHDDYLKQTLRTKKQELENLKINNVIHISTFNDKKEMITAQIDSIEKQLKNN